MSTTKKGDKLEDALYDYLCDQKSRGILVYGAYPPNLCMVHKQKSYHCAQRQALVTFDVVIEFFREGSSQPHFYIIFECKNHERAIEESRVTDFSDKIGRIFGHALKGIIVVSSRLQSGAENLARSRNMGIVKFDQNGVDVVAERKSGNCAESAFIKEQIFESNVHIKSLKFSAFFDGSFYSSSDRLLASVGPEGSVNFGGEDRNASVTTPYVSSEEIQRHAGELLNLAEYRDGPVDLVRLCSILSLDLSFSAEKFLDADGNQVLGSANFDRKLITVNYHNNRHMQRFTIGHEVGHFYLGHGRYFHSESIVEKDLLDKSVGGSSYNLDRLEYQANLFASNLLLPTGIFLLKVDEMRSRWDIVDKGHGFIFVDDQPCNYGPYNQFIAELSSYFDVSIQALEVRLKKMMRLTDQRKGFSRP